MPPVTRSARLASLDEDVSTSIATNSSFVKRKALALRETSLPPQSKRRRTDVTRPPHSERLGVQGYKGRVAVSAIAVSPPVVYLNPLPCPQPPARPAFRLFFWGTGDEGQFGIGNDLLEEICEPRRHPWVEQHLCLGTFGSDGAGLEAVAAGGMHTLFLDEMGTKVWSCGVNDDAALGRTTENVLDPEHEGRYLDLEKIPYPIQTLVNENFRAVKIVAGDSLSAVLSESGDLRVWGSLRNKEGPVSLAGDRTAHNLPTSILKLTREEKLSDISCGANHLVMLTTHGNIYTWGVGESGQLGSATSDKVPDGIRSPERIFLHTRHRRAVVVGAGNSHSFAVDNCGDVWGWGLNAHGQTGTGFNCTETDSLQMQPKKVVGLSEEELGGKRVIKIAAGEFHSVFLVEDGRVFACGRSVGGELGIGKDHVAFENRPLSDCLPVPTQIAFPNPEDKIIHIAAGARRAVAITESGELYTWGEGGQSELGLGKKVEQVDEPTIVKRPDGSWKAVAVSCGGQHTLGLFRHNGA